MNLVALAFGLVASTLAHASTMAFVDVTVLTMTDDGVLEHHTVLVEDGRIVMVAPSAATTLPADTQSISGGYLMPGLAEMHAHLPADRDAALEVLALFAARGITTVRGMLGAPLHLQLREEAERGDIFSPRIIAGAPSLNGNTVDSPEHGARQVREHHAAGYDHLKIHPGLSVAEFDAIAGVARELGMPFAGHVPADVGLWHALEQGMTGIDHLDGFVTALVPEDSPRSDEAPQFFGLNLAQAADESAIDALARRMAEAGTWLVPTESLLVRTLGEAPLPEMLAADEMRFVSAATRSQWRQSWAQLQNAGVADRSRLLALRRSLLRALDQHGAHLLLGSDAPQILNVPGFSIAHELNAYVDAGLSPTAALATGTRNVGRYLRREDVGIIAPGAVADLVLLGENPLMYFAALDAILGVMLTGRWHEAPGLDQRLNAIAGGHAPPGDD